MLNALGVKPLKKRVSLISPLFLLIGNCLDSESGKSKVKSTSRGGKKKAFLGVVPKVGPGMLRT